MATISGSPDICPSSSGLLSGKNGDSSTSASAEAAVNALREAGLGDVTYLPGEDQFDRRVASYWSRTSQLRPWAIVQPGDAYQVSAALKALVDTPGCQIAIRSGGHMACPGASSIEAGVTIDLGLLNTIVFDVKNNVASLGPSARWGDVYAELEKR
jgi:FAD/FMN-containing dehydrogenase